MGLPLQDQIADHLSNRIATGDLHPGDNLPSIRQLSATWGCSDGPVRLAFRKLVLQGLIETKRGAHARVAPEPGKLAPSEDAGGQLRSKTVRITMPLATDCSVTVTLTRQITGQELDDLIRLVSAMGPIVIDPRAR